MAAVLICGKDADGINIPIGIIYDEITGLASVAVSRGAGKNTFSKEYGDNQTNEPIITPSSGKKVQVVGILTALDADTGDIKLDFTTSKIDVWRHYGAKFRTQHGMDLAITGAADEALTLNSDQGEKSIFILVNYRVVD